MTEELQARGWKPTRRTFLAALVAAGLASGASLPVSSSAQAEALSSSAAQRIADHFSSIKTMAGDFVQIGPTGKQTGGKFYIDRPGKIRFNYDSSSPLKVVSNGSSVAIGNTRLGTWQLYPLSSTPLKLLLSRHIDLGGSMVKSVKEGPDLITIVLGDRHFFGNSTITMMFDPASYDVEAMDDNRRPGQGHDGDDLQRADRRATGPEPVRIAKGRKQVAVTPSVAVPPAGDLPSGRLPWAAAFP